MDRISLQNERIRHSGGCIARQLNSCMLGGINRGSMSYRFMRIFVFFDLPVLTASDRRAYAQFRKALLKSGFLMLQESVYCKLALNAAAAQSIMQEIRNQKPSKGLIQMLMVTEKQFARMEFVLGEFKSEIISSDQRLVIL